jgi:hypothetical protein
MRRFASAILVSGFCLLVSIFGFFFHRDNFSTHYPLKAVSASAFRAGEIPYWNPFDAGGQPLAGNPNALTFYPDNVLYLVLPAHVAFNLHFLIHLVLGWLAMRALTRSTFGAWMWVLSGIAVSAMSFYSLITAIALIPFALLATERRSAAQTGLAFGLMALAGEPVTILATALACAIVWAAPQARPRAGAPTRRLLLAIPIAVLIALPQVIAYAEIARETERGGHGYSAATVLSASLEPKRLLELVAGPLLKPSGPHLFPTLLLGVIVIPALFRKSRYTVVAAVMLFFALGRFNPIVRWTVESFDWLRIARYPEKFALPLCAALVVLAADFHRRARWRFEWTLITLIPLATFAALTAPIDAFSYYRVPPQPPVRVYMPPPRGGQEVDRDDYRLRARRLDPIFGAVAGVRYVLNRSPDGMHSLPSRVAAERFEATRNPHWLQIALMPDAVVVPSAIGARTIPEVVNTIESAAFDPRTTAVAPMRLNGFRSAPIARIVSVRGNEITVIGPALVRVNASYFRAWDIGNIQTFPLDLDRLGFIAPAGKSTITLRFGRHRGWVVAGWVLSSALLVALLLVQKLDRRAGEVERAGDDDGLLR